MINLLSKFYKPDEGDHAGWHRLGGVRERFAADNIGLVLQKNHIFKGSIYDNILYGKMDATARR